MSKRRMTEKDAIKIAGVLGGVILLFVLLVVRPFSRYEEMAPSKTAERTPTMQPTIQPEEEIIPEVTMAPVTSAAITGTATIMNMEGMTLSTRINAPEGYMREEADGNSLTAFLRNYKVKKDGKPVLLHDGSEKANQDAHVAVLKLPLESGDLQQCADSVMRVYAEYFWNTDQKDKISFQFVNGFEAKYVTWREGYRIEFSNTGTSWVASGSYDDSYETFQKYMRMVFAYSSTLSMQQESKKAKKGNMTVGDVFLEAGSPGHVVMVIDECVDANGKKAYLLGQGYMPAQQFHVLKNPLHEDDPWYYEDEIKFPLETPEYTFNKGSLRRMEWLEA